MSIKDNLKRLNDSIDNIKNRLNIKYNIDVMAVSKTRTSNEILEAINEGQFLFGENRVLEAYEKFNSDTLRNKDLSLHIIGHLQRNKAKKAVEIAENIQSIDKLETLNVIENFCIEKNKNIEYLIEVNTTDEPQKYGIVKENYFEFLESIQNASFKHCKLTGLMTVGPFTSDKSEIRSSFRILSELFDKSRSLLKNDKFSILSMGMSNDYDIAIEEGSNFLRVGSIIFGNRTY